MTVPVQTVIPRDLVSRLMELVTHDDRAGLAALRRGLGHPPGTTPEMFRYVEPFLRADSSRAWIAASYLAASLFGLHPVHADGPSGHRGRRGFGASLRAIRLRPESSDVDTGIERRFVALLSGDREALPTHLRHLVSLLRSRSEDARIDYRQLVRDIAGWDAEERYVQRAWAAGFWGDPETTASDDNATHLPGTDDSQPG